MVTVFSKDLTVVPDVSGGLPAFASAGACAALSFAGAGTGTGTGAAFFLVIFFLVMAGDAFTGSSVVLL